MERQNTGAYNSTYPKVAVHWLNQALCFYQSFCLVDSEVLLNRHLRVAAKRYNPKEDLILVKFQNFSKIFLYYFQMTGLFHDPEKWVDASKILKTFFKSFGIFLCLKFSQASLENHKH
ncbi:hypothetical protein M0M57_00530 [Flavobacterium azooxidireducens]|uniref:Uncharacterized protein n=1 Tax=Flavobacterium azooxidireducens TaxID=1871076 RepID=A0ABY4KEV6_9FLAO|nr:hypothetical protein [Flavobacterium azooxidireducens]UPQ79340.1 hypothetical protein M0M57_00530 [Flavobacterium azooxidireducens]